ncbi:MAG: carboxypeptidase regulatory-like domain-containing protein, partial [Vicinamibacterales bacterium]
MRAVTRLACMAVALVMVPALAYAQASIAGVVRDASGGVLPGVTVEAASPALIEKVRSVATDGSGQYQIVDLRPGSYTVTFTLPGFSTVRREGIELSGSFVANVNAELRVGAIEETVTVTGEAPTVDIQSVTQQRVLSKEVIDAIPTSRTHFAVGALVPGVTTNNRADVGGTNAIDHVFLTAHGGRTTDQRVMLDGLSTNNAEGSSQYSGYLINMGSAQEVTLDVAAGSAEQSTGGVRLNVIPREGGNTFRGTLFASGTNEHFAGSNLTDELRARGLQTPTSLRKLWDVNPSGGGPILRDRLWFYAAGRANGQDTYSGGFYNLNEGTAAWTYAPDLDRPAYNHGTQTSLNLRLTWQASVKNKVSFFYDKQTRCWCQRRLTPATSPEGISANEYPYADLTQVTWSSPATNRLLLEAGGSYHPENWRYKLPYPELIGVSEQSTGMVYRGATNANGGGLGPDAINEVWNSRASASYITAPTHSRSGSTTRG